MCINIFFLVCFCVMFLCMRSNKKVNNGIPIEIKFVRANRSVNEHFNNLPKVETWSKVENLIGPENFTFTFI